MNNKGFAITTILYGTLILFCLLLISMLGILSTYKKNLEKLINATNGTRDIIKIAPDPTINDPSAITKMGLYNISGTWQYYYPTGSPSEPEAPPM